MSRQHGVISRSQLVELGFSRRAIEHRIARGRLHPVRRGVFAIGRPALSQHGRWMAAVLAGGAGAVLSHRSAGALLGLLPAGTGPVEITVASGRSARIPGLRVHRRTPVERHFTRQAAIPVTTAPRTLADVACQLGPERLERAVNEADRLDLIDPESLLSWLADCPPMPGTAALRRLLARQGFAPTDSVLEQRFLSLTVKAGLPLPRTQARIGGYRVDFYWPQLGLVVETDGLRYHRTPAQQARDRNRDQAHLAAGRTPLRFTAAQITRESDRVASILARVAEKLRSPRPERP